MYINKKAIFILFKKLFYQFNTFFNIVFFFRDALSGKEQNDRASTDAWYGFKGKGFKLDMNVSGIWIAVY